MSETIEREREVEYSAAIDEAVQHALGRDDDVFVIGEDVELLRQGLKEDFPDRIRNTPISETAFIGAGTGAAYSGLRPIVELMFIDFFGVAMDQIYNQLAKITYYSDANLQVPMVIRAAYGGGYRDAGQHQQCLYSIFGHVPGLKVAVPSTPYDAKGMMTAAINTDDPVLFFEHKLLSDAWLSLLGGDDRWPGGMHEQFDVPKAGNLGSVPEEEYEVPLGQANIKREGDDVTIVTLGAMVHQAIEAAEILSEEESVDCEVVDLRSVVPLDEETVIDSVRKTGRVVVVDEDYERYGLTGEIAAIVSDQAFDDLDAPVKRVATEMVPIPFGSPLEDHVLPSAQKIQTAVQAAFND
jgi:pyruvate dehydrogenase E1 component beta subunit